MAINSLCRVSGQQVGFTTKSHDGERRQRETETVRLSGHAFIARHVQYVSPAGTAQARHCGLHANANRGRLNTGACMVRPRPGHATGGAHLGSWPDSG
ncbi:MAG: hypothetical protein GKR94_32245 [Gammaproteobacteria bacterium]|nr:hypothetical protein [Gammaproteobacteria bacterium]